MYCVPATGAKLTLINAKPTLHAYVSCLPSDQYSGDLSPVYRTGAPLQLFLWHGTAGQYSASKVLHGTSMSAASVPGNRLIALRCSLACLQSSLGCTASGRGRSSQTTRRWLGRMARCSASGARPWPRRRSRPAGCCIRSVDGWVGGTRGESFTRRLGVCEPLRFRPKSPLLPAVVLQMGALNDYLLPAELDDSHPLLQTRPKHRLPQPRQPHPAGAPRAPKGPKPPTQQVASRKRLAEPGGWCASTGMRVWDGKTWTPFPALT